VPNFPDNIPDDNISQRDFENLFRFQIGLSQPKTLNERSFYVAGVTPSDTLSRKAYEKLCKTGILVAGQPTIITGHITRQFAHHLSILTSCSRRKLVNMLFMWEEELMRWQVLEDEAAEIKIVIEEEVQQGGDVGHLVKRLMELDGQMRLKPSMRGPAARAEEQLPEYEPATGPGS